MRSSLNVLGLAYLRYPEGFRISMSVISFALPHFEFEQPRHSLTRAAEYRAKLRAAGAEVVIKAL